MSKDDFFSSSGKFVFEGFKGVYDVYVNGDKKGTTEDSFALKSGDTVEIDFEGNEEIGEIKECNSYYETLR